MKPLFILLIAIVAFAFGYRFYSKLLALGVFGLEDKYSTSSRPRPPDRDYIPTNPYFLLGHHVATIAAGATVAGSVVAAIWGWVPAFLWVVTGTAVAAGTYGMGSLWLCARRPGAGVFALAAEFVGRYAAYALAALAALVLLMLNAIAAGLAAQVLADNPAAAFPFWLLAAIALAFGTVLHGRRESALVPATAVALTAALAGIWFLRDIPVALTGGLNVELAGAPFLALNGATVWVVLLFVYSYYAARAPLWKLSRPRGYLTALLAVIAVLILYAGMALAWPTLAAPEFNTAEHVPGVFPWLFVTVTSGALAGFHLLVANGISAKQLRRDAHARVVGYGGALADGVLALSAVLVAASAFADAPAWHAHYGAWDTALDLPRALALYLDGFARFGAALGLTPSAARTLGTVVLASLSVATLEAGVRVLKNLLVELAATRRTQVDQHALSERSVLHIATWSCLLFALADGRGLAGLALWSLFGSANLLLAGLGLILLGIALRAAGRAAMLAFAPAAFAVTLAMWALVAQTIQWTRAGHWFDAGAALVLIGIAASVLVEALRRLRQGAQMSRRTSAPPSA